VKSEQAKGLILESKMMMMMVVVVVVVVVAVAVVVVAAAAAAAAAVYHLLLFFHMRPAKHHKLTVVTLCLSDAHDVGSGSSETLVHRVQLKYDGTR